MANTKLTISMVADVREAKKNLESLGYKVEEVKNKTDKASKSADLWNKSLEKASKDNINNLIKLGSKFLSVTTAAALAYKGIKSCFDEAVKRDNEAGKRLDEINSTWSDIKADLGSGLLDAISPALDTLYEKLTKIAAWVNKHVAKGDGDSSYEKMLDSFDGTLGGGTFTYQQSLSRYSGSLATTDDGREAAKAKYGFYADNYSTTYGKYLNQAGTAYWDGTGWTDLKKLNSSGESGNSALPSTNESMARKQYLDSIANGSKLNFGEGWGNWDKMIEEQKAYEAEAADDYMDYEDAKTEALKAEEDDRRAYIEQSLKEQAEAEKEAQQKAIEEMKKKVSAYKSCFDSISSSAMDLWDAIDQCQNQTYENEIERIENSEDSEETKAEKIDAIKRKQFDSDKANSAAQSIIDTASAIMNVWATAGSPYAAGILTALVTATGATQLATILGESYTGLATGGIVQSPTHALIGEGAEKEAVMPLSKLEDFVQRPEGNVINLTINVDGGKGGDVSEDVFYAIERAQRTGLLPNWSYA